MSHFVIVMACFVHMHTFLLDCTFVFFCSLSLIYICYFSGSFRSLYLTHCSLLATQYMSSSRLQLMIVAASWTKCALSAVVVRRVYWVRENWRAMSQHQDLTHLNASWAVLLQDGLCQKQMRSLGDVASRVWLGAEHGALWDNSQGVLIEFMLCRIPKHRIVSVVMCRHHH